MNRDDFLKLKERMVAEQIRGGGVNEPEILKAFLKVNRHLFVPPEQEKYAYADCPLPIGEKQTISQPFIVALMSKALEVEPAMKVLEIGTGSGYQAAILYNLGAEVFTVERIKGLAETAKKIFKSLNFDITSSVCDGTFGWEKYAPYDRIIVTAASSHVPKSLFVQLKVGGRLVAPIGDCSHQNLIIYKKKSEDIFLEEKVCSCIFVPLIGQGL